MTGLELLAPGASGGPPTRMVELAALVIDGSPRREGENAEHIELLAHLEDTLPPILVHRPTMRVIDGIHRVRASRLRGRTSIEAMFFDGGEDDAFVLAVQANISHGLPLSLADREAAAERIIRSHAAWSDRTIAAVAGLSPKTVGALRARSTEDLPRSNGRLGRDGRVRPVSPQPGRLRAAAVVAEHPGASVREVAKLAAVSIGTAHDVIARIAQGLDPLATQRRADASEASTRGRRDALRQARRDNWADMVSRYQLLCNDPSVRYSEQGRSLLRWLKQHMIDPKEWRSAVGAVPEHWAAAVAELAEACAQEWQQLARELGAAAEVPAGRALTLPGAADEPPRVRVG